MNANEYQFAAGRTLLDHTDHMPTEQEYFIMWNALGLAGEASEVADLVKKGICHQHGLNVLAVKKELGDVLWYVAALCTKLGLTMDEVMSANIEKLRKRYPDGYSSDASRDWQATR